MMRIPAVLAILLLVMSSLAVMGEDKPVFAQSVKASLLFSDDCHPARRYYPHIVNVFVRLENASPERTPHSWVCDIPYGIEAELFDPNGIAIPSVPVGPGGNCPQSSRFTYTLPFASRLDWLVSNYGDHITAFPLMPNAQDRDKYAVMLGFTRWLVPIQSVASYSLRIRIRGYRGDRVPPSNVRAHLPPELLFDIPPTKIVISK